MNRKVRHKEASLAAGNRSEFNGYLFFFFPLNGVPELLHLWFLQLSLVHINISI